MPLEAVEMKNAKITRTMLGFEDHGILTYMLYLDYGGSGQGAGGICCGNSEKQSEHLAVHVVGILETVGVETWEGLPGKDCRVLCGHAQVYKIGNYLRDKWWSIGEMPKEIGHA